MNDCNNLILSHLNKYDLVIMKSVSKYYNNSKKTQLNIFKNNSNTINILTYYNIIKLDKECFHNAIKNDNIEADSIDVNTEETIINTINIEDTLTIETGN